MLGAKPGSGHAAQIEIIVLERQERRVIKAWRCATTAPWEKISPLPKLSLGDGRGIYRQSFACQVPEVSVPMEAASIAHRLQLRWRLH